RSRSAPCGSRRSRRRKCAKRCAPRASDAALRTVAAVASPPRSRLIRAAANCRWDRRAMSTATSELSRAFAQQIHDRELELPMLPSTAAEVMSLCQLESTDAAKLSAVIHRDQTIAVNVLRVANSAAFAGQVGCASLQQAVSRLGMQLTAEIAMAVSVRGRLFESDKCRKLLRELWRHSVLSGFFAKEIARLRRRNVEIA